MTTKEHDEDRYLELIRRNSARIGRLCRAWTRTAADLEDLRAEVHLQLWRALPSFGGRSSEDTWLYRVTLNTAMLAGRRRDSQAGGREVLEREAPPPTQSPGADESLEREERIERLRGAIATLPPGDRAVISLVLEDAPYRQIAEVTGLTENHVAVRVLRIKRRLAELMTGAEVAT